jgi:hypothetical protein
MRERHKPLTLAHLPASPHTTHDFITHSDAHCASHHRIRMRGLAGKLFICFDNTLLLT